MSENKKTKTIAVVFLLIIVAVSSFILFKLYKTESTKTGTVKTYTY